MQATACTKATAKTLVILCHPHLSRSRINAQLVNAIHNLPGVVVRHLDSLYPGGKIDVKAEQHALEQVENVVFQFPTFWYSPPALLKAYFDEVMLEGWAYNRAHTEAALWGKTFRVITSAASPAEAYSPAGWLRKSFDQVLVPLEMTAFYLGMHWREYLLVADTFKVSDEEIENASMQYIKFLQE